MPLPAVPIIVWGGVAVAAGVLSISAAYAISRWVKLTRTVAFIGRSAAGKSTLVHILEHGDVPKSGTPPTVTQRTTQKITIENMTAYVVDSGGDRLAQWESAVSKSRGVVYFFDASLIARNDKQAQSALWADADHIKDLLSQGVVERRFTLVGTHSDLFHAKSDEQVVRQNSAVQRLRNACEIGNEDVLIGSLAEKKAAMRLVSQLAKRQSRGEK